VLIGIEFLTAHKCVINFDTNTVYSKGEPSKMVVGCLDKVYRITVAKTVNLVPEEEKLRLYELLSSYADCISKGLWDFGTAKGVRHTVIHLYTHGIPEELSVYAKTMAR